LAVVSTIRSRAKEPDQVCAEAVDLARQSLVDDAGVSPDAVGGHLGVEAAGDRVVTHLFDSADPAYTGWRWAVTVTRAPRSKLVTVDESVLLPGPEALLAPPWVPWQDRLRPGDVGIGDLLPASPDDERLVSFVVLDGDDAVTDWFTPRTDTENSEAGPATTAELPAPGRSRVLSALGRDEVADRWYSTDHGPRTPLTHAAPANCVSCGFFVPLSGGLGRVFGACGNAYAPDDGRVVSADHGCGAHSEAVLTGSVSQATVPVIDEFGYDLVDLPGVSVEETVFEPLSRDTYPEAGPEFVVPAEPSPEPTAEPSAELVTEPSGAAPAEPSAETSETSEAAEVSEVSEVAEASGEAEADTPDAPEPSGS
jgi:Protein of unknown function (DUF3027)